MHSMTKRLIILPSFPPARGWGMPVVGVLAFAVEIAGFSTVNDIKLFPFHFNLRAKYTEMCYSLLYPRLFTVLVWL